MISKTLEIPANHSSYEKMLKFQKIFLFRLGDVAYIHFLTYDLKLSLQKEMNASQIILIPYYISKYTVAFCWTPGQFSHFFNKT